jgi:hypothetical protein
LELEACCGRAWRWDGGSGGCCRVSEVIKRQRERDIHGLLIGQFFGEVGAFGLDGAGCLVDAARPLQVGEAV